MLPIEEIIPELKKVMEEQGRAVLVAAPGAGKTTQVPLALLDEPWLEGRRILMLEPRRLAARAAARYMASLLGEAVGETVGYRVRLDSRVGPKTRLEVITEGVLTRMLQEDPALEGVGLVIFDEFHERSLHADLGLALCLQSRNLLREDLRLLVMSATLEAEPVARLLGDCPILVSEGRSYPVETRYLARRVEGPFEALVAGKIKEALAKEAGDILCFLPGAGEIRRVADRLAELVSGPELIIAPLYGQLPQEEQDRALRPAPPGKRKVVLATAIAETSLTVEGIGVVIDCGRMRVPRFSPRTGMTSLVTVPVSRASADQRRGRAGRLGPGVCYRLWTEGETAGLVPSNTPEIREADLAPLALELAVWGVRDPAELAWLDLPPPGAYAQARELLCQLGALDEIGLLTPQGKRMARLGLHPRLARMILQGLELGLGGLACELGALLGERDILRGDRMNPDGDLRLRVAALRNWGQKGGVDQAACRRIEAEAKRWKGLVGLPPTAVGNVDECGLLLAFAFPDRIAQGKGGGRFLLRNGRGAVFAEYQPLSGEPYLVAAELSDQGANSRIYLAAPVDLAALLDHFRDQVVEEDQVYWEREGQAVRARRRLRLDALVLKEQVLADPPWEAVQGALLAGIAQEGLDILPWSKAAFQLRQRMILMGRLTSEFPDVSEAALIANMDQWLGPHLYGLRSREDLGKLNLTSILEGLLTWDQRRELDEETPTHYIVPSGSKIPIDYSDPEAPFLAVRLQEVFGLQATPVLGRGRVPLTIQLLSPARRPVQVTRDLASFWREAYFEVRKDLKGRYPKHYWPDDPHRAEATRRVRPDGVKR